MLLVSGNARETGSNGRSRDAGIMCTHNLRTHTAAGGHSFYVYAIIRFSSFPAFILVLPTLPRCHIPSQMGSWSAYLMVALDYELIRNCALAVTRYGEA